MARPLMQPNPLPFLSAGLTKGQIAALATQSVDKVLEDGSVFQVAEALAVMEEFARQVRKDERFVSFLRDELLKHHGHLRTASGAKLETCEAGVLYDYSKDGTWRSLDEQIRHLQEQKRQQEEKLRHLSPGRMAVDPETGEVLEGALKTSKSTYRITLSK
ncbi:hypothetical protein V9K67_08480 [Paraflavisolibacter sp. H34]|uniref:hypothetical protein n=1 Tax=Huijunlia imazamoxiresistens TaxID=3127457 RepID=UPI00301687A3